MEKAIKILLKKIDSFERKVMLCYLNIMRFFGSKKAKVIDEKIQNLKSDYELLIKEYNLIKEKKSALPLARRREIVLTVSYLIGKGHIVINQ